MMKEGYDLIVVAGGDGTISEVSGCLIETTVPLGIIPMGTGNILARELDIPLDIDSAVQLITGSHRIRKIDAIQRDGRTFILNISVGISALTVRNTTNEHKTHFGCLSYAWTALRKVFQFRLRRFTVTVDNEILRIRSPEVTVANSGFISDMLLPEAPDIHIDDGFSMCGLLRQVPSGITPAS